MSNSVLAVACVQADKAGARLKQLKRQVEEGEEEMARVNAQKRKLQRDVEEQTEQSETTQRELEQLRSKLRTGGGDKARYVCLSNRSAAIIDRCRVAIVI